MYWALKALLVYVVVWPVSLAAVYYHGTTYLPTAQRLPDLLHHLLTEDHTLAGLTELLPFIPSWGTLVYGWTTGAWWLEWYINYMLNMQLCRSVVFNLTVMPDSSQRAHAKPWWQRYLLGGVFDLNFSGHVMYYYAPVLFLWRLGLINADQFEDALLGLYVCMYQILCSRNHYSVDLVSAVAFSHWMYDVTAAMR